MGVGQLMTATLITLVLTDYRRTPGNCIVGKRIANEARKGICLGSFQGGVFFSISATRLGRKGFAFGKRISRPLLFNLTARSVGCPIRFFIRGAGVSIEVDGSNRAVAIHGSPIGAVFRRGTRGIFRRKCSVSDLVAGCPTSPTTTFCLCHCFACRLPLSRLGTAHTGVSSRLTNYPCMGSLSNVVGRLRGIRVKGITPRFSLPSATKMSISLSSFENGCMLLSF